MVKYDHNPNYSSIFAHFLVNFANLQLIINEIKSFFFQ